MLATAQIKLKSQAKEITLCSSTVVIRNSIVPIDICSGWVQFSIGDDSLIFNISDLEYIHEYVED